jgi:cell division protein FtsB
MDLMRLVRIAIGVGAVLFAVQGGEYSTVDLVRQRTYKRHLAERLIVLQRQVDSLTALAHAIATDPATQERIAREEFGMVRGNELLYRFAAPRADTGHPIR